MVGAGCESRGLIGDNQPDVYRSGGCIRTHIVGGAGGQDCCARRSIGPIERERRRKRLSDLVSAIEEFDLGHGPIGVVSRNSYEDIGGINECLHGRTDNAHGWSCVLRIFDGQKVVSAGDCGRPAGHVHITRVIDTDGRGAIIQVRRAVVADDPEWSSVGAVFDGGKVIRGACAQREACDIDVACGVQGEGGRLVETAARAVVAGDPELVARWTVLHGSIVEGIVGPTVGDAGDIHVTCTVELKIVSPVGVIARAVVAGNPHLRSTGRVVFDGRKVGGAARAQRTARDVWIIAAVQHNGHSNVRTVARAVVAGNPKLVAGGVVFDSGIIIGRASAAVGETGDIAVSSAVHSDGLSEVPPVARTIVRRGPELIAAAVVLQSQIIKAADRIRGVPRDIDVARQIHCQRLTSLLATVGTIVTRRPNLVPVEVVFNGGDIEAGGLPAPGAASHVDVAVVIDG